MTTPFSQAVWLSGGTADAATPELAARIETLAPNRFVFAPPTDDLVVIGQVDNAPEAMRIDLARPSAGRATTLTVEAYDAKSRPLGRADVGLAVG